MSRKTDRVEPLDPLGFRPNILAFHKMTPGFSFGSTNYPPRRFRRLLAFLKTRGYRFRSVTDLVAAKDPLALAVTFDDGYKHLADALGPLVPQFDLRPLVFVPTAYIGKDNTWDYSNLFVNTPHLDRKDIAMLAAAGVQFGSHGHRHLDLTQCDRKVLGEELRRSKGMLEDILGKKVDKISYPFGRLNRTVSEAALEAGYEYGFTMSFPNESDEAPSIGRLAIYGYDTLFSVLQKIRVGPAYRLEKLKAGITNRLSRGTVLWRRLTDRDPL